MLTLRSTAVGTTLILAYEAEVVPIGRKRGTSVATESFHIHFLSSGILILMSQKKKKVHFYIQCDSFHLQSHLPDCLIPVKAQICTQK